MKTLSKNLIIYGSGGHGKVILNAIHDINTFNKEKDRIEPIKLVGFLDDGATKEVLGFPMLGGSKDVLRVKQEYEDLHFIMAIGTNSVRKRIYYELIEQGLKPMTIIHPTACISEFAEIGKGTYIGPFAVIQVCAKVGDNIIINTRVTVEHDCIIEDHSQLCPSVTLSGTVIIKEGAFLGTNSCTRQNLIIGKNAVIGVGGAVVNDIPSNVTVVGVPARRVLKKG